MSVIVVAPRVPGSVDRILAALARQTVAGALEVVVVREAASESRLDPELAGVFHRVELVTRERVVTRGPAFAAGLERTRGGLVALLDDHSRPAPDWAEVVAGVHRGPWAVVGSVFENGNAGRAASRASFLITYGRWASPSAAGEVEVLPALNVCYERSVLEGVGSRLGELLDQRTLFVRDLVRSGRRAFLTDGTRLIHLNSTTIRRMVALRRVSGQLSAATIAARGRWGPLRRGLHVAASPALPVRRLLAMRARLAGPGRVHRPTPSTLLALGVALVADAAGRARGYASGPGASVRRNTDLHLEEDRALSARGVLPGGHLSARRGIGRTLVRRAHAAFRLGRAYVTSGGAARRFSGECEDVESYVMFVGYPRSGHSLVGALLDAHPDAVVAHELGALQYVRAGFDRARLFYLLAENARRSAERRRPSSGYTYHVPGQWQGRWLSLRLIGDKKAEGATLRLRRRPELMDELRERVGVPVRMLHVVRNPFDNIATMATRAAGPAGPDLDTAARHYFGLCETVRRLEADPEQRMLTIRYEELVRRPEKVLGHVCHGLGLEVDESYLAACAEIVYESPHRSRFEVRWLADTRRFVESAMDAFPHLAGYRFGS